MPKILVIEDDQAVRENLLELLESENFDVLGAENGILGVQLAREVIPDLILCDVMMPELDGHGVIQTLRGNPTTAMIPFIFLTARADKVDFRQGMELGADDYLTKPCTADELLRAVATRLQKQAALITLTQTYVTALNEAEERLNHLLHHDSLTGLSNQLSLRERLTEILSQQNRAEQDLPILLLQLNRWNRIYETLGYALGDRLLQAVADRLKTYIGPTDSVARLNTDQFIVILADVRDRKAMIAAAQALLERITRPFLLDEQEVYLTANIGIALHPHNGNHIDTLIKHADVAMHYAQQKGVNQYEFYSSTMKAGSANHLSLEANLRRAIERQELQVYYQPQVNLCTGQIIGAEALLRWFRPEAGFISPADFIPLAEETGLIIAIDEWVLAIVCAQAQAWQQAGLPSFPIAVNLSGLQFHQENLYERISQILRATRLEPRFLELELTESILVQNTDATIRKLHQLKKLGVQIAIDDFGTGYSSLGYLKQFPFDTLKIDRCFVSNIANDSKNAAITTAMIQMAHSLGLKIVAEGVETELEFAFLRQHECDHMQGYLFSRPLPKTEFEQMIAARKHSLF
jgi:diguanylate cyclase (GGDEF)-like protein